MYTSVQGTVTLFGYVCSSSADECERKGKWVTRNLRPGSTLLHSGPAKKGSDSFVQLLFQAISSCPLHRPQNSCKVCAKTADPQALQLSLGPALRSRRYGPGPDPWSDSGRSWAGSIWHTCSRSVPDRGRFCYGAGSSLDVFPFEYIPFTPVKQSPATHCKYEHTSTT